ncbi:MAG TPA: magnesium transporter [Planktothrix sp.]|jgi:magnesium transporter
MEPQVVENNTEDLKDTWDELPDDERYQFFTKLARADAEELFLDLTAPEQAFLLADMAHADRRSWIRLLEPDDAADVIQESEKELHDDLLSLLDPTSRNEVTALLAYAEDVAGGLMSPRYARLRPGMTAGAAIRYLHRQSREQAELISYAYVVDPADQTLLGMVSFRDLCAGKMTQMASELMTPELIKVSDQMDQEEISHIFAECDLMALPVVDDKGRMKGIVTIDDIVDVVSEEATEDIQKLGGSEALDAPYMRTKLIPMVRKRGVWLTILFLSEMLTATAMGYYENEIQKAVVLSLFIPLIISSGGNAGSQATTLVIRAMALDEVEMSDVFRVAGRELVTGIVLGCILGVVGLLRIVVWQAWGIGGGYGEHFMLIALTIFCSLIGVVAWGTIAGATVPFILRACGTDPATASTPFIATLVDVTGLIIYFTTASIILRGTLL